MKVRSLVERLKAYANQDVEIRVKVGMKFKKIINVSCDINGNLIIYLEDCK